MAVYVDDMYQYELGKYGRMKMSHMLADTDEELHEMAQKIGVARKWWQNKASGSHYDIAMSKREKALELGAIAITLKQAAAMNARRKALGYLGDPETAVGWLKNKKSPTKETS